MLSLLLFGLTRVCHENVKMGKGESKGIGKGKVESDSVFSVFTSLKLSEEYFSNSRLKKGAAIYLDFF